MILITQNDFTERTGVDLSADVREDGITSDRQATALIELWETDVYEIAHKFNNCIDAENLNDKQIDDIKQAVCSYGLLSWRKGYVKHDPQLYDLAVNSVVSTLRQHGLIVNGFKGTSGIRGF